MQTLQGRCHRGAAFRGAAGVRRAPRAVAPRAAAAAVEAGGRATKKQLVFPFTRIQGQEDMKLALLLNVVDPNIGGVLIMGDRGTAKSVGVRAIAQLLPQIDVVEGDPFNSSPTDPKLMGPDALQRFRAGEKLPATTMRTPLVELPLGATEDRICGTIDIEKALTEGVKAYEPGLLVRGWEGGRQAGAGGRGGRRGREA
jgi:magnesium chelatase subunit I